MYSMGWKIPALSAVVGIVVLTVGGVAIGLVVHGGAGALLGAVPGALAGVAAGFVPALRDHAEQRRERANAARLALVPIAETRLQGGQQSPASLLRPERAVVKFAGRESELEALRAWCAPEAARSVRVLVGAGGVGKTRLALQLAAEFKAAKGRRRSRDARGAWLVKAGREGNAVPAARGVCSGPVLLVVDYAETRAGLEGLLAAVLADGGPVRVLLLARSLGEWSERLAEESDNEVARLFTESPSVQLDAPVNQAKSDAELATAALPDFAAALGVPVPQQVVFESAAGRVPLLVLHAAALVAVLRSAAAAAPQQVVVREGEVLGELLEHEARYWRRSAKVAGFPDDGSILKPVVAAAALLGAADQEEAAELIGRVPELAGVAPWQRLKWAQWLYGLYPAGPDRRLGSLQPDLLAEAHVTSQLAANSGLAQACLRDLTPGQAEHALTVLARARPSTARLARSSRTRCMKTWSTSRFLRPGSPCKPGRD